MELRNFVVDWSPKEEMWYVIDTNDNFSKVCGPFLPEDQFLAQYAAEQLNRGELADT